MDFTHYIAGLALLLACMLTVAVAAHLTLLFRSKCIENNNVLPEQLQEEL